MDLKEFEDYIVDQAKSFSSLLNGQGVFPVGLSPDGKSDGKHPLIKGWNYHTTGFDMFHPWWKATGYGVNLDGLSVIDFDYETPLTALPETLTVKTARGYHYYYKGNIAYQCDEQTDLKQGQGAFAVGPGSLHQDDWQYEIVCLREPAEWPYQMTAPCRTNPGLFPDIPDSDSIAGFFPQESAAGASGEWVTVSCLMPDHLDVNPSFSANLRTGYWFCRSCGKRGTGKRELQDALDGNYMKKYWSMLGRTK